MFDEQGADKASVLAAVGGRVANMTQRDVHVLQAIGAVVFVVAMLGMFTLQSVRLSQLNRETASLRTQLVGADQEISDLCISARDAEKRLDVLCDELRCLSRSLDDVKWAQQQPEQPQLADTARLTPVVYPAAAVPQATVKLPPPQARRWYYLWLY